MLGWATLDRNTSRTDARKLGKRSVGRVRVDTPAAATGSDEDQRIDPIVDRGRVPRMGTHPGPAVHRREQAGYAAPEENLRGKVWDSGVTRAVSVQRFGGGAPLGE